MPEAGTALTDLNLQARLEQIEAGIQEAHNLVSRMTPRVTDEAQTEQAGATGCAARCMSGIVELNVRLDLLANTVGTL